MRAFKYARPTSLRNVFAILLDLGRDARLLAGGTDLIVRMKTGAEAPRLVLDLKGVPELSRSVELAAGVLRVGALVTLAELAETPAVRQSFPALAEAALEVGSSQIRNRATLAGNLCNASPAADTAPPLLIYEARVILKGPHGDRQLPLADFFKGPGLTALCPGEVLTAIELPLPGEPAGSAFVRLSRRRAVDLAIVSVAALVTRAGQVRLAIGAAAPTPVRASAAEAALAGRWQDPAAVRSASALLADAASPIDDVRSSREYRLAMLPVLGRRAVELAAERLLGEDGKT